MLVANIDSGQKIWVNSNQLYELSPELKRLSEVATCAALAGIEPKNRVTSITSILASLVNKVMFPSEKFCHLGCVHTMRAHFENGEKCGG